MRICSGSAMISQTLSRVVMPSGTRFAAFLRQFNLAKTAMRF